MRLSTQKHLRAGNAYSRNHHFSNLLIKTISMITNKKKAGINSAKKNSKMEGRKKFIANMSSEEKKNCLDETASYISISPNWPVKNDVYVELSSLISNSGKTEQQCYGLLRNHDIINADREWNSELIDRGVVVQHFYQSKDIEFELNQKFVKTLVSPHGQVFFEEFFELAEMLTPNENRRFIAP